MVCLFSAVLPFLSCSAAVTVGHVTRCDTEMPATGGLMKIAEHAAIFSGTYPMWRFYEPVSVLVEHVIGILFAR